MGIIYNIIGIVFVVMFTQFVDWSLFLSIPVGIVLAIVLVIFLGVIQGMLRRV